MAVRALVFIEDNTAARVIAARLERDGLGCIVVARPGALVEEARRGPVVLVVQSQYSAGDVGAALLRQVRVARGDVAPAVVVVVGDLAAPDRHVLERQWKVQAFVPQGAPTQAVIEAVHSAARSNDPGRPGVRAGGFDLVAGTTGPESDMTVDAAAGNNDPGPGEAGHTVVMPESQLQFLRHRPGHDVTGPLRTSSDESDLSQLPPPGGDNDIALDDRDAGASSAPAARRLFRPPAGAAGVASSDFAAATSPGMPIPADVRAAAALNRDRSSVLSTASPLTHAVAAAAAAAPPSLVPRPAADPEAERRTDLPGSSPPSDAEDAMQIQELQRTQAELKKALLAERRAHEAAQKRVEELEARLAKMGEEPASTTQGVPTEGVFEDLRYPALLARCRAEGFTGSIVLQTGGAPRTVFLKDGLPIAFSSSEPGQRIGKLLVAQGRITDEQYMKAATLMVERSIKLTDALVELRLIDAETLAVEQRNTTRDQIIQGFEVVQGRFQTHAGAVPDANTATFDFGPGEVYVQGYRRYAPASEMQATYETLRDRYLATNARLASYRSKLGLTGDDERFLRLLGEAYTVDEASERSGIAPEAVARLLAALQALDLVEEWSPGVEQFRARLRTERQRAAEELARVLQEATSREEKLLTAFQQALAAAGAASLETGDARGPGHRPATPATNTTRNDPLHPDRSTTSSPPQSASRSTAPGPSTASAGAGPGNSSTSSWGTGSGAAIAPAGPASVGGMAHASTANASMATTASPLLGSSAFSSSPSSPFSSSAVGATGAGSSSQGNAVLGTPAVGSSGLGSSGLGLAGLGSGPAVPPSPTAGGVTPFSASSSAFSSMSAAGATGGPSADSGATKAGGVASSPAHVAPDADPVSLAGDGSLPGAAGTGAGAGLAASGAGEAGASSEAEPAVATVPAGGTRADAGTPDAASTPAQQKYQRGLEHEAHEELEEAENALRDAVRLDHSRPEYLVALARVLLANTRYERAGTLAVVRPMLDVALKLAPDDTEAVEMHQMVVFEMGS